MPDGTKMCSRCRESKPYAAFNKRAASKDGVQSHCKLCAAQYGRSYHAANRDQLVAAMAQRYQDKHDHEIARARAYREANRDIVNATASRYYHRNLDTVREKARIARRADRARQTEADKARMREYLRVWTEANRAYVREKARAWRAAHPEVGLEKSRRRYARKRAATIVPFTLAQLEQRMSMFPGCWMCGGPKEEVDHVKPLAKGGAHTLSNLRPACRNHNARKNRSWPFPTTRAALVAAGWFAEAV